MSSTNFPDTVIDGLIFEEHFISDNASRYAQGELNVVRSFSERVTSLVSIIQNQVNVR